MDVLSMSPVLVKCPHCGNKFSPEDAIGHDIRLRIESEFEEKMAAKTKALEEKIRKREAERHAFHLRSLEEDRQAKATRLKELEGALVSLEEREQKMRERADQFDIELKRKLMESEKLIYRQAEERMSEKVSLEFREREQKMIREREAMETQLKKSVQHEAERVRQEERLKLAELQKKLDDQSRLVDEMKRKSEQGSMQLQGEVQELAIEAYLKASFARDEVLEIAKGKRGGDCVHIVKDQFDRTCGRVLYESKRTRRFAGDWIAKIKSDMRLQQADIGVIVTEAFPDGMTRFGEIDGVWVCSFTEFRALAVLLRHNLVRIGEVLSSQENRGEKMQMIYSYVTGNEFRQKLEAAFESYGEMQEDLVKEKNLFTSQWARREKKLLKAMENIVALYGDVRGIAGGAVQQISALEIPEQEYLAE